MEGLRVSHKFENGVDCYYDDIGYEWVQAEDYTGLLQDLKDQQKKYDNLVNKIAEIYKEA